MSHSLVGEIYADIKKTGYNSDMGNFLTIHLYRKFDYYDSTYDKECGSTTYCRKDNSGPFISVISNPKIIGKDLIDSGKVLVQKNLSLIISIESGSHVGFADKDYATEIDQISRKLKNNLSRDFVLQKEDIALIFRNGNNYFTPREFRDKIKEWN